MLKSKDLMPLPKKTHPPEASTEPIETPQVRARFDDAVIDADRGWLARARPARFPSDVEIGDWGDLLNAVKARLRLTIGEGLASTLEPQVPETAGRIRDNVLECVAALDQLHTSLTHELGRRQHVELQLFDAQTALAQARAEAGGISAGERRAGHRASHDGLTSLPNRGFFRERLDHALALAAPRRQALAVLYLDLDGFKPINDEHGHQAGDELLRVVAMRLTRSVRSEDMVSRLGGDEFACLFAGLAGREQLSYLACKLFDAVSAPFQIGKLKLAVRPSIGIATCPADGTTSDALLKNADGAMYRAKRHQTGYAFHCSEAAAE